MPKNKYGNTLSCIEYFVTNAAKMGEHMVTISARDISSSGLGEIDTIADELRDAGFSVGVASHAGQFLYATISWYIQELKREQA